MPVKLEIETFDYDDVMLVPEKCEVKSRSAVDVSAKLGKLEFKIPVVPANMSTIIDETLAKKLASEGYFYVMHRFDINPLEFTRHMQEAGLYSSVSLGIKQVDFEHVDAFKDAGVTPEYITIDIAHGHADSVVDMIKYIKSNLPDAFVIAGNVGTREAALELAAAGANGIKVGIGPGCFTGDMLVNTKEGLKAIKEIETGDEVLTHTGKYQKVLNTFAFDSYEERISINGIDCTTNHEFYVCNKKDQGKITEDNYQDYCYWISAGNLDDSTQLLIKLED